MVKHLPSKCEAPNSNLSTTKRKKEGKREKEGGRAGSMIQLLVPLPSYYKVLSSNSSTTKKKKKKKQETF
jgi:hypothetical protein